jgi:hypothetical protein
VTKTTLFHVKILDFKYLPDFTYLNFRYLVYEVLALDEEDAILQARKLYMKDEKAIFSEEIPS